MSIRIPLITLGLAMSLAVLAAAGPVHSADAAKSCGTFQVQGLLTDVRVVVNRGSVSCHTARGVMKKLFGGGANRKIGSWDCVGPQTGFAQCRSGNRRITAHF